MTMRASLYDGATAVRHSVEVLPGTGGMLVRFADGSESLVAPELLLHIDSRKDCLTYGRRDIPGWRLALEGQVDPAIVPLLPRQERYGRLIDRIGLVPAVAAGLAFSALVILAGMHLPQLLAPHVPQAWEERYGDALVGDFGGRFCSDPAGNRALAALTARLAPDSGRFNVRVVNIPIVNAAALPGGNIVIFEELLEKAAGPDEVAGVLAHEIAHIEKRHVTQAMIRHFGIGMIVSLFGGNVGTNVEALASARYSRGSEREADSEAIESLRRAGISPLPTAAFFERMAKEEGRLGALGKGLAYISSHPLSAERQQRFRASAGQRAYRPSLSDAGWKALRGICTAKGRQ